MPELPEVETTMRGIAPHIKNRTIIKVEQRRKDLRFPFPKNFVSRLEDTTINSLSRRAKYILVHLDSGETLIIHLGMSGSLVFRERTRKHDHVVFTFDDGLRLVFNDPRRFGLMDIISDCHHPLDDGVPRHEARGAVAPNHFAKQRLQNGMKQNIQTHKLFAHLGAEPLEKAFNSVTLEHSLRNKKTPIKTAIMDQTVVVGVGNIYASESLFLAKISPLRPANSLKKNEYQALVDAIKLTLKAAIKSGGSTLRDFVRSSGDTGYFQHQFNVYGRENKPCLCAAKHGILTITPLVKKITQQGRATYYCSTCQK
jgi:formamidopyrimidine-DNA glycosylase